MYLLDLYNALRGRMNERYSMLKTPKPDYFLIRKKGRGTRTSREKASQEGLITIDGKIEGSGTVTRNANYYISFIKASRPKQKGKKMRKQVGIYTKEREDARSHSAAEAEQIRERRKMNVFDSEKRQQVRRRGKQIRESDSDNSPRKVARPPLSANIRSSRTPEPREKNFRGDELTSSAARIIGIPNLQTSARQSRSTCRRAERNGNNGTQVGVQSARPSLPAGTVKNQNGIPARDSYDSVKATGNNGDNNSAVRTIVSSTPPLPEGSGRGNDELATKRVKNRIDVARLVQTENRTSRIAATARPSLFDAYSASPNGLLADGTEMLAFRGAAISNIPELKIIIGQGDGRRVTREASQTSQQFSAASPAHERAPEVFEGRYKDSFSDMEIGEDSDDEVCNTAC